MERIEKLSEIIVNHSIKVKEKEKILEKGSQKN